MTSRGESGFPRSKRKKLGDVPCPDLGEWEKYRLDASAVTVHGVISISTTPRRSVLEDLPGPYLLRWIAEIIPKLHVWNWDPGFHQIVQAAGRGA